MKMIIGIEGLTVCCIIGCLEHERTQSQSLTVDVQLSLQLPAHDVLEETVDYTQVASLIEKIAVEGKFLLIETLARACVQTIFATFVYVQSLTIRIKKPAAIQNADSCFVEISDER